MVVKMVVRPIAKLSDEATLLGWHHGLEKIKTVRDTYVVAGGSPNLASSLAFWP
jgi:hypothetical protein